MLHMDLAYLLEVFINTNIYPKQYTDYLNQYTN